MKKQTFWISLTMMSMLLAACISAARAMRRQQHLFSADSLTGWTAMRAFALSLLLLTTSTAWSVELINASYDVSRELFDAVNPAFAAHWKATTGEDVVIRQSHGGSSKQARAVAEGLPVDVVTFNQVTDIDFLQKAGVIEAGWSKRLPNKASPYYSLPMFLVRAGNPKKIRDWSDLARSGVQVIFPNPKTSGNGRYTYLAAYAYALDQSGGDHVRAAHFATKVLANVPVFDTGGRGATTTFIEREIGDVLVTFECEVTAIRREYGKSQLEAVMPSLSLRADFPVSVVDGVVERKGTRRIATAYLEYLFSPAGQQLLAKYHYRVLDAAVAQAHAAEFEPVRLVTVEQMFGGWDKIAEKHFAAGGILDLIMMEAATAR
jgi:sulfate/thiosulfate transport system substrate-binding protein